MNRSYLILHREGEVFYGVDLPVRWFEDLQQNGVCIGSGGAFYHEYYRMSFRNGAFEVWELGRRIEQTDGPCAGGGSAHDHFSRFRIKMDAARFPGTGAAWS